MLSVVALVAACGGGGAAPEPAAPAEEEQPAQEEVAAPAAEEEAMEEEEAIEEEAPAEEEAMEEEAMEGEALLDAIMASGTLRVSTDPNYAPQSLLKPDGTFEGFDIDVATEIANRLGVEIEFVTPDWDVITAGNWGDQWDISVGSMTVTKPRAEILYFTSGYYFTPAQFAARAGSGIESLDDIAGQTVCVGTATTYETYLNGEDIGIPAEHVLVPPPADVTVVPLTTDAECAQAIQAGRTEFDVFLTSGTVVDEAMANGIDVVKVGEPVFVENLAVAIDKNSSLDGASLRDKISEVIDGMHADGTLSDFSQKWFDGVDLTMISGGEEAMAEEEAMEAMALPEAGLNEVDGLLIQSAGSCDYGGKVGAVQAVDELTVQFTMCRPDPAFLAKAAFTPFGIQPREHLEATGGSGDLLEQPVGTGPFMLESWNRGDSVVYQRFDDYWGEPAIVETLVFRWATEGAARLLELQSGTVDQITNVSPDDFETVANDPNLQLLPVANPNVLYLAMTNTFEPFGDIRVRQAIAMGIDRQRIVDNFYPDGSEVASHFTPCSIANGCTGEEWYGFDPEAAKALLAEAGYPDGFETSIFYRDVFRGYLPEPGLVAVEFQTQLQENLNIAAEVVVMESGEFIAESTAGNLDGFYLLGWGADYPHVTNFLDFHFSGSNPQFGDPFPEIYEVLEEAATIGDSAEAEPLYVEANNAIKELVPMVPIAHGASAQAALAGISTNVPPFGAVQAQFVDPGKDTFVFMQNAEPISLYCGDETDGESLSACQQVVETLLNYKTDSGDVVPALATGCEPNEDSTVWTCTLREGVTFHDGSSLDANDVVASWAAGIDAANPLHVGNTGAYEYYSYLWDGLMNAE
jgi:ABC-type transport system substrate-binding protein/ABC-type amino acid transport substrate-binding protein